MATYRMSAKPISRGKGQSAVAAAAYRSGTALRDQRTGEVKDYSQRDHAVIFEGIFAPADAPAWARDREELWNRVEAGEKRKDAQLAREFQIALPHEMTDQQREWLVKDFVREQFTRSGYVVDVAIHRPDREGDERNHHAHLMVTLRTIDADGFAATKDRSLNTKEQLAEWREEWADLANRHLARHGIEARIDHRSNADRGLEAEPTKYEGPAVTELARQGIITDRRQENDEIRLRNAERELRPPPDLWPEIADAPQPIIRPDNRPDLTVPADLWERDEAAPASRPSPQPSAPSFTIEHDWTNSGGMVAQQASAAIWARDAQRRTPQHAQGDEAPSLGPDDINRQQTADREKLAASPIGTHATETAAMGQASPAPAAAPSKSAKEIERDEILAAFDRTRARSVEQREQEQDGGRELDR